ncbi:homoserine kinase [Bacillota bacterium LX-D]|nr:homoserine kinase [Bacillota bacterium LX-D]
MIKVRVPATTANLGPGFDTLGMSLDLYNYLELAEIEKGLEVYVQGEGEQVIPKNSDNIVLKAIVETLNRCKYKRKGLQIKLINHIPVARGLGSSAAAIVGGVYAANLLAGNKLSKEELLDIAVGLEGHPDNVAPALLGGILVSSVKNNSIIYRRIKPPEEISTVVAIPNFSLSTKVARNVLPEKILLKDAVFNVGNIALLVLALASQDYDLLGQVMEDKLHQPYRMKLIPGMDHVFKAAIRKGALGVALSGAGPTLIAFTRGYKKEVGEAMQETFQNYGVSCSIKNLKPTFLGAETVV